MERTVTTLIQNIQLKRFYKREIENIKKTILTRREPNEGPFDFHSEKTTKTPFLQKTSKVTIR